MELTAVRLWLALPLMLILSVALPLLSLDILVVEGGDTYFVHVSENAERD